MKRWIAAVLSMILCLSAVSCGENKGQMQQRTPDEKVTAEQTSTAKQTGGMANTEENEAALQPVTSTADAVEEEDLPVPPAQEPAYEDPWSATAPGHLSMEDAAAVLAEEIAYRYWDLPPTVEWRPVDMRAGEVEVFDVYYGDPVHFCCTMQFYLLPDGVEFDDPGRFYWEVGSGLGEPLTEGDYADYYIWSREVLVQKNAEGNWYCAARGTGGYTVYLPYSASVGAPDYIGSAPLADLVRFLTLTKGFTHDWILPMYICEREEELAQLNEILPEYTQEQVSEICRALASYLCDDIYVHEGPLTLSALQEALDPVYHKYFS